MRSMLSGVRHLLVLSVLLAVVSVSAAAEVRYIYDDLNRLIGVVDPSGESVQYTYDAVGNLLSITRRSPGQVSLMDFSPHSGPVGATVTISGTGFSPTPSQNAVAFNGVSASVTSATPTQLVTAVPTTATTGPLSVTAPAGSATSGAPFTVTAPSGAPAITGFTPAIATAGTPVTISGTGFAPGVVANRVLFNLTTATVQSATPLTIATTVPPNTGSGRLAVTTAAGTAVSAADCFVPPAPYPAAAVAVTGRMAIGQASQPVSFSTGGVIGLVVFDGSAGQRVSLGLSGVTILSGTASVYTPLGTVLASTGVGNAGAALEAALPVAGTYTVLVAPSYAGSVTLTLSEDLTGSLAIGGPAVPVSLARPGQSARLIFSGTAGQRLGLGLTGVTLTQSDVSVLHHDGTTLLAPAYVSTSGAGLDLPPLPTTDSYTILVDPRAAYTGGMTLTLSEEVTGPITVGGSAVPVSLARVGQRARLTFEGTAGQRVSLGLSGVTILSSTVAILNPDGTTLASSPVGGAGGAIDSPPLPVTGTYAVLVDPFGTYTGGMTLTLSEELTGSLATSGPTVPLTLRAGQNARLTFEGTAGQQATVRLSANTLGWVTVSLLKPDGTSLTSTYSPSSSFTLATQTLPTTGVYTITLNPSGTNTGSITVSVTSP